MNLTEWIDGLNSILDFFIRQNLTIRNEIPLIQSKPLHLSYLCILEKGGNEKLGCIDGMLTRMFYL